MNRGHHHRSYHEAMNKRITAATNAKVNDAIGWIIDTLKKDQNANGSWNYPFETGISTDCYMIILLRTLELNDEKLIQELTERILSRQEENGAWKLFFDEGDGNLSSTLEAYYSLLYSGYYDKNDLRLQKAKKFILENGGIKKAHMFTKIMLAMTGQYKWPTLFPIPVEVILLPQTFPFNFYSFSEYGRANLAPIMILADRKFKIMTNKSPNLKDLLAVRDGDDDEFVELAEWRSMHSFLNGMIKNLIGRPAHLHQMAIEQAKQYMLRRIEPDGTFLGYFSSTFLMIFALIALGFSKRDPTILKAVEGLKAMKCEIAGISHMQYTTATVWNTALIAYAIQEAGISPKEEVITKANQYLLSRQHYKYGDWSIHNPNAFPGGWGFADINTIHSDVDDTTASLRAIARMVKNDSTFLQAWERGISWVLSMQNDDGGWPAFEKNTDSKLLKLLPIERSEFILTDPSSADLTGRTLEFLGTYTNMPTYHPAIQRAVKWLRKDQRSDGSWYGRWGICFIYGTWGAITGLRSVGILPNDSTIVKAVSWLKSVQNKDGGWGESCKSDSKNKFVPLGESTLIHTAWAVDALIVASDQPTPTIRQGINYLVENIQRNDWTTAYPKGQGMAGGFYIHYHSYRYIFPLLALAHYKKKYFS